MTDPDSLTSVISTLKIKETRPKQWTGSAGLKKNTFLFLHCLFSCFMGNPSLSSTQFHFIFYSVIILLRVLTVYLSLNVVFTVWSKSFSSKRITYWRISFSCDQYVFK